MSDVTVAPPSAAPSAAPAPAAPAPAANQVPINQNPVNSQNPVGPQAPPAHVEHKGSEHRTESRREAIQKAFERANNPQGRPVAPAREAPKPAQAKPGHNQPPEETPRLNLKKRPDEQAPPPAGAIPRSEKGQFAPRQQALLKAADTVQGRANGQAAPAPAAPAAPVQNVQSAQNGQRQAPKLPDHAPYAQPPVRMGEKARRDWAGTPESVRGDIHRIQAEFAKAYQFYKDDHEAFKPLKHYHKMAQEHGTTLEKALDNYVGMETKLRADPIAGLDVIIHNLDLKDPETGRRLGLRDISYYVLNQSPEQLQQMQNANTQQAAAHQIGALHQEIVGLKETLQQWQTEKQFTQTRGAIDQYAVSHPRFDELADLIEKEVKLGFDIDQAYARAALLRPATHAAQTRTTPAQTRPVDRSISGAPGVAPSDGASRRPQKPSASPRDAVYNALRRVNGVI